MFKESPRSFVFSNTATWLLYIAFVLGAALLFQFIIPSLDPHAGERSIGVRIPAFLLPVLGIFLICALTVCAILGRRIWVLFVLPGRRPDSGA